jgi:hypothetical protein
MEEIIRQVSERTGLPADGARTAAETVINFLKSKLPAALHGQIDQAVSGGAGALGDVAKGLGGMLGKKQ